MVFSPEPSYTYNDLGLKPRNLSKQRSRNQVDPGYGFFGYDLSLPIILAPMETVVGGEMIKAMQELEGLCVTPRTSLPGVYGYRNILSVGLGEYNSDAPAVCIDVANGFHEPVGQMIKRIKKSFPDTLVMAGNVASTEGYHYLADCGADAVRIGIGGGSVCTTSVATGVGVGQASIVREIAQYAIDRLTIRPIMIADGGIKAPGDVVKAIALGADVVMAGGIFAGCKQSPGRVLKIGDSKFKHLAGQASMYVKGQNEYVEGADKVVPYTGDVAKTWKAFDEGIRSGLAYMDCGSLEELRFLPDEYFVYLSDAAKSERRVHA